VTSHRLVRADNVDAPPGDPFPNLVWFAVACSCAPDDPWHVNYWKLKFKGPDYVGRGGYVDKAHGHQDWVCLVVTFFAWGYADALKRVQGFQDAGVPPEWAWQHLQSQGRA
jgi:hypothetical protein